MPQDVLMFWLIHLFLGIIIPVLMLTGCCREDETAPETLPTPNASEGWEAGHAK